MSSLSFTLFHSKWGGFLANHEQRYTLPPTLKLHHFGTLPPPSAACIVEIQCENIFLHHSFPLQIGLLLCQAVRVHGNFNIGFVMNTVVVRVRVRYIQGYHWYLTRDSSVELEDDPRPLCVCVMGLCVGTCMDAHTSA